MQGVIGGDDVIGGYRGLEGVIGSYRAFQGVTGVTGGYKGFRGSQRVIGGYNVFFIEIVDLSPFASKWLHGFTRGYRWLYGVTAVTFYRVKLGCI